MTNTYQYTSAVQKAKECLDILLYLDEVPLMLAQNIINQTIHTALESTMPSPTYGEMLIEKCPARVEE